MSRVAAFSRGRFRRSIDSNGTRRTVTSKRLLPPMDDRLSVRRGIYRVIYRIDEKARVVTVVDVAHRRDAYRT